MPDSVDIFGYMSYMRLRWKLVAASCLVAVALTAAVTLTIRRQYTATARILIELPAGAEPRSVLEVSAIYLESLKTYEQLAANDSLFQRAAERFQLRALLGQGAIEGLKRRVLRVGVVRNSRILEVSAILPDAKKAQALAQFLAEQTVALNQSMIANSGHDLVDAVAQQEREAQAQFDETEKALAQLIATEPTDDLQNAIYQAGQLRGSLEERVANLKLDLAGGASSQEQSETRARLTEAQQQLEILNRETTEKERLLAARVARRQRLEDEHRMYQAELATMQTRLRDTRNSVGFRGERLTMIDPGVVPERPTSPNVSLNLSVALLLGLMLPLAYLLLEFGLQQHRTASRRGVLHALAQGRDE